MAISAPDQTGLDFAKILILVNLRNLRTNAYQVELIYFYNKRFLTNQDLSV